MIDITLTTALSTFLPAAVSIAIAVYVFVALPRHRTITLFALLSLSMACWQIADGLFISVPTAEQALFVHRFFAFSWCMGGALALHFALSFAGRPLARSRWIFAVYAPFFLLLCLYVSDPHSEMEHDERWGWVNGAATGTVDALTLSLIAVSMLLVIAILFRHAWLMRRHPLRRAQAALVAVGILVPTLTGIVLQVVFPLVLKRKEIPLASELMTFFSLTTIIALRRYRLFDISESLTLDKVLQQLRSIVLVVLPDYRVQSLNSYTSSLFDAEGRGIGLRPLFCDEESFDNFTQQVLTPAFAGRSLRNNLVQFAVAGRSLDTLVAAEPVRFRQTVQGVLLVASDITEYLQVVEERSRAERMLEEAQLRRHREITEAVLAAQENERRIIGAELHDNVNQILTSAKLYLGLAASEREGAPFLQQATGIIGVAMQEVRKLSHALIPPSWSGETLAESLRHLLLTAEQGTRFSVYLDVQHFEEKSISPKLKLTVYRIVQEQLNNIIKHAGAKTVRVSLRQDAQQLLLRIVDDGGGFDPGHRSFGVGLKNMETRAQLHDGALTLRSSAGQGCSLEVSFPAPGLTATGGSDYPEKRPRADKVAD
ncbi:MAG: hypothetical protein EOO16_07180 [Chitinophagaceae bacterium]|nr:MAG: hypothetical protein EOO16_07180 [Chitinophagaceae bacterium]